MGMNNESNYRWEGAVQIRTCPYLNNVVEQDHRRVKSRVGPMLGFKRFFNARRVVAGVELVQKIVTVIGWCRREYSLGLPRLTARQLEVRILPIMTPILAMVTAIEKRGDQYQVIVQISPKISRLI